MAESYINKKLGTRLSISGTNIVGDIFQEDYFATLRMPLAYSYYDKMRRSDYQIARLLRAIYTPLLTADFSFNEIDNKDPEQIKQANIKNKMINDWADRKWEEHLQEILSFLVFGYSLFEPFSHVIEDTEFGKVVTVKNLGFIKQSTINGWKIKDGKIESVHQYYSGDLGNKDIWIDGKNLVIFTNQQEGDNFEGISILRAVYGNYIRKDLYSKLDMIGLEKHAIGTPIFYVPDNLLDNEKEKKKIETIGESYIAHERQYILLPEAMKDNGFEIKKGEYNSAAINAAIKREDVNIIASILASFMDIGTMQAGGNSQSESQQDLFLNSLVYIAKYIADKISDIIHNYYVFNFGEPKVRLNLSVKNITRDDAEKTMKIITGYVDKKVIYPDNNLEDNIRKGLNLPDADETTKREVGSSTNNMTPDNTKEMPENIKAESVSLELEKKDLTALEKSIDLKAIKNDFVTLEKQYKELITKYLEQAKNKYLIDVKNALKQSNREKAISNINMGYTAKFKSDIKSFFYQVYDKGISSANAELKKTIDLQAGKIKNVSSKITMNAEAIVLTIENDFNNTAKLTAIDMLDDDFTDAQIIKQVDTKLGDYINSSKPLASTGASVNKYYNMGRNNFFFSEDNLENIKCFQYSAVLDERTTDVCTSLSGQMFYAKDESSLSLRPPNHWGCRSILIAVPNNFDVPNSDIKGLKLSNSLMKQVDFY